MEKNKQAAIFLIIGILALATLFFLASRPSFFKIEFEESETKIDKNITPDIFDIPVPYDPIISVTVPKTGWRTYNNPQYGFSFEYPPDYELETHTTEEKNVLLSLSVSPKNNEFPIETDTAGMERFYFSLSVTSDNIINILKEFTTNPGYEDVSIKDISLNNLSGKLITSKFPFTGEFVNDVLYENKDGEVIHVFYFQNAGNDTAKIVPNSILDTILQSIRPYP